MPVATLCFLIRGNPPQEILLGFKRVGFGAGKFTGIGGKVELGESVTAAAVRELHEEIHILAREADLQPVARLSFRFPAAPSWSQQVHVFGVSYWDGHPTQSEEITPIWFTIEKVPYNQMWQDAIHWLPHILAGNPITATFVFQADNETIGRYAIHPWHP
jgi:8-oxo-dGTP diphosphatase